MEVFPADVAIAEKRTGGNPNIIYSKEFMPVVKADKSMPLSASKGMFIVHCNTLCQSKMIF